jgi:transglutaminase-like putative cysteine protease
MFLRGNPGRYLGDVAPQPRSARATNPRVRLMQIPEGDAGTRETLKIMADYARAAVRSPEQVIRRKAAQILSGTPPRQYFAEIRALHAFVRDQIRYLKDPVDMELVQTPEATLEIGQGDCDDKATLLAALLTATGHRSQFVAIGFDSGPFSHVLVETQVGRGWMPLETIIPKEPGWFPEGVKRQYRRSV